MAKSWGSCDYKQLQKLRENLGKLQGTDLDKFCQDVSKELAARLLALVIPRTPVGRYKDPVDFYTRDGEHVQFTPHSGKNGGSLRRAWTIAPQITKVGNNYQIEVINTMDYASYVEFGHDKYNRRREYKGWQEGQYFLTISEQDLRSLAPALIEKKLAALLREVFRV